MDRAVPKKRVRRPSTYTDDKAHRWLTSHGFDRVAEGKPLTPQAASRETILNSRFEQEEDRDMQELKSMIEQEEDRDNYYRVDPDRRPLYTACCQGDTEQNCRLVKWLLENGAIVDLNRPYKGIAHTKSNPTSWPPSPPESFLGDKALTPLFLSMALLARDNTQDLVDLQLPLLLIKAGANIMVPITFQGIIEPATSFSEAGTGAFWHLQNPSAAEIEAAVILEKQVETEGKVIDDAHLEIIKAFNIKVGSKNGYEPKDIGPEHVGDMDKLSLIQIAQDYVKEQDAVFGFALCVFSSRSIPYHALHQMHHKGKDCVDHILSLLHPKKEDVLPLLSMRQIVAAVPRAGCRIGWREEMHGDDFWNEMPYYDSEEEEEPSEEYLEYQDHYLDGSWR